jgi:serine/threonine protein kinase
MGVCTDPNNVALVMEYVEGKGLDRILHDAKVPLSQTQQLRIAKDIAKGTIPPSATRLLVVPMFSCVVRRRPLPLQSSPRACQV